MSASLARYLKDFSAPPPVVQPESSFGLAAMSDFEFDAPVVPEIDLEEERRAAFEEGRAAMRIQLEAAHAEEIAALQDARRESEARMTQMFETEIAVRIANSITEVEASLTNALSAHVFNALLPLIDEQMAARAAEALVKTVHSIFQDEEGIELVLRGPQSLAGPVGDKLAEAGYKFRHIETDEMDLTVEHGDTVLMTRLSAWAESVGEILK
jgi:hypothetical protein